MGDRHRLLVWLILSIGLVAGCSPADDSAEGDGTLPFDGTGEEQVESGPLAVGEYQVGEYQVAEYVEPQPAEIDSDALLAGHGFVRCESLIPNAELTDERRQEIYRAVVDADLGQGAALDPGYRVLLLLYVLDEPTLAALADIADPSEVCLNGQDPNDFVPLGPQQLEGPGWRWVGAGTGKPTGRSSLITNQGDYDDLWPHLGEGPETEQPDVDFDQEVILAISHGSGVNFGRCGKRFDGYTVQDGVMIVDWPSPGGYGRCPLMFQATTYAVAVDRNLVEGGKLTALFRVSPRDTESEPTNIFVGKVITPPDG